MNFEQGALTQENPEVSSAVDLAIEKNTEEQNVQIEDIVAWAKQFNSMSETEIQTAFSDKKLIDLLKNIPTYFEGGIISEEILEAEARIYSLYKPSEALHEMHKKSNFSVIDSYVPQELFMLREQWKSLDTEQKLSFIQSYVKKLAEEYGFNQEIIINILDQPFGVESAMWVPTHESNKVGSLFLCKSEIEQTSFTTVISTISHEISHAFQEYLRKQKESDDILQNDKNWLSVYNNRLGEQTSYTDAYKKSDYRYKIAPPEKDAWSMQLFAPDRLNSVVDEYAGSILKTVGFDSYVDFKEKITISKWLQRKIEVSKNIDDLHQEIEKLGKNFPDLASRISEIILTKDVDSILAEIEIIEDKIKIANEKLSSSVAEEKKEESREEFKNKELKRVRDNLGI